MNFDACPHHNHPNFLSQEGIFCRLCNAFRQLAALSQHSMLAMAIEKLSSWTIRSLSVNGLPDEILIEIFQYYLSMGDRTYPVDKPSCITAFPHINSSPVLLAHVNQAWRQITMTTPMLWSSMAIHNPRRRHIPLISLWLDLAGSCPLSISIRHGSDTESKQQTEINTIMPLLINRSHLWKSIEFELWNIQLALNIPFGSMHMLQRATLNMMGSPTDYNDKTWALINSSPQISSVKWFHGFSSFNTTPWERLKTIECTFCIPIDVFLRSLHFCPNLEVLIMTSGVSGADLSPTPSRFITLPALKKLDYNDIGDGFRILFSNINTPVLTTLGLSSIDPKDLDAFRDFMARSKCILKSFDLCSLDMTATELLDLLETPGLSLLAYVNISIKPDIPLNSQHLNPEPNQSYLDVVQGKVREFVNQNTEVKSEESSIVNIVP